MDLSKITVVTPVGPGHEAHVEGLNRQVRGAGLNHVRVWDSSGSLGRSAARSKALGSVVTPWVLFIDADDEVHSDAIKLLLDADENGPALLGAIDGTTKRGGRIARHRWECDDDWDKLHAARDQICISGLFPTHQAREIGFLPDLDRGEDIEFVLAYCATYAFKAITGSFTWIRCDRPSAGGPRGYTDLDWKAATEPIWSFWKARGREPMTRAARVVAAFSKWAHGVLG